MQLMIKYPWQSVSANEILIRRKIQEPSPEELTKFNERVWIQLAAFILLSFLISIKEFN